MKSRPVDAHMVQRSAAEQWYDAVSRMDTADALKAITVTTTVATNRVQYGMMKAGGKMVGGVLLNATTGGALTTYTIWSELGSAALSDEPVANTFIAVNELFNPVYIAITRTVSFVHAMDDFDFEAAGENLGEAEIAAVTAASFLAGEGGAAAEMEGEGAGSTKKGAALPRFDGPKPTYAVNDAHVPGRGLRPGKTPLPGDAGKVFLEAVPNDPVSPTAWFGKNGEGQIYRYSLGNDGTAHFSGIQGVGDGTRNITPYALKRLGGQ